ncbi:peptidyl-tRNA hydrolase-domain-containing protein [Limtongia smithiae]|uniref:peptidyl-tRNA hydrolase-domain-containing protein n=1 Tax=Limtongia smithiae TaxID=1125753 RepID=UPI0034CFF9FE
MRSPTREAQNSAPFRCHADSLGMASTPRTAPSKLRNLLVCSIGNPGPQYASTRHSVGHIILNMLVAEHGRSLRKVVSRGLNGELHLGQSVLNQNTVEHEIAFFKSISYMNTSGPAVLNALHWSQRHFGVGQVTLVVLHDEMSLPVGKISARIGGSTRGHNGLKSIVSRIPAKDFVKLSIGIDRPVSHDPNDVAEYVLSKIPKHDLQIFYDEVYPKVFERLAEIELGAAKLTGR